MPDFDREFLAPVREIRSDAKEAPPSADPDYIESLRDLFNRVRNGEGTQEVAAFLDRHDQELDRARQSSEGAETVEIDEASDGFRILFLDFVESCQTHQEVEAFAAFDRCGKMLRQLEARPSLDALLVNYSLRSQWLGGVEKLIETSTLPPTTRQGLVGDLTRYRSDPEFPSLCFRYEYAFFRNIYVDSYLEGDWETAGPAGRRLFVRQLELAFARNEALAKALEPGADPKISERTLWTLREEKILSPKVRELRKQFAKSFYSLGALTEADGRDFAEAIDEWIVFMNNAEATPNLGRLDDSLRELYQNEDRLIERLSTAP